MTGLLFTFLSATLISQSFMDALSLILALYMVYARYLGKTRFLPITAAQSWRNERVFIVCWLAVIIAGLWQSPRLWLLMTEWKWILNLYFLYWFMSYYLNQLRPLNFQNTYPWLPLKFWRPLMGLLLVCFGYGIVSYLTGIDQFKQTPLSDGGRFGGPFDDPMNFAHIYGMYLVFLAAFLLDGVYSLKAKTVHASSLKMYLSNRTTQILLVTLLTTALSLYLSLTRGAWLGVFLGLVTMFFVLNWRWGIGMVVTGALSAILLFNISGTFRNRVNQALNPAQSYDSERINLWRTNWAIFEDHPFIGVGNGDYKGYLPIYFQKLGIRADHFQSHAHNQYLQFLSNTGIIGFCFYMFFIGYILLATYKGYRHSQNPALLGSLGAQISFHVGAITECNFERAKVRLVYLFFCALALSLISFQKKVASTDTKN